MFLKIVGLLVVLCPLIHTFVTNPELPERNGDKFYYFGFGSNMLSKRIHMENPTAVKIGPGKLKNYRLDFNTFSGRWDGAPATIVPTDNAFVYGTLWEIDLSNLDDIDHQEGVHEGMYYPVSVPIMLGNNTEIISRAYMLADQPKTALNSLLPGSVPLERQPSKTYLQCLVKGAIESGIETWYVDWLKSVKHNGHVAKKMEDALDLQHVELSF